MIDACINSLSLHGQFNSNSEVIPHFVNFIDALYYLLPSMRRQFNRIIYDTQIEMRSFVLSNNFQQTLSHLRQDPAARDAVVRWYLFTKKHCVINVEEIKEVCMEAGEVSYTGLVGIDIYSESFYLFSIGGSVFSEAPLIVIKHGENSFSVPNICGLPGLYPLVPRYEASEKHRLEAYMAGGVEVSPMPLNSVQAQLLLQQAVKFNSDYWAFRKECGNFFRFKPTHVDRYVFHGFQIREEDVPEKLRTALRNDV